MPGSNSLDFLTAYIENFQHFLFEAVKVHRVPHDVLLNSNE
jgi:hypothetical protein